MIKVDIVMPLGGFVGGVENVIKTWVQNLDRSRFCLRVFHMSSGINYLEGYEFAYAVNKQLDATNKSVDFCVQAYQTFIQQYGAPDVCIATSWPMATQACDMVRKQMGLHYTLISWLHSSIMLYENEGLGDVNCLKNADVHFAISEDIKRQIQQVAPTGKIYVIGNPVALKQQIRQTRPEEYHLVFVGRLAYVKRLDIILEALYKAKAKWHLKIIGDGDFIEHVEGWIKLLKLEQQVELLGWKKNPSDYCDDASALIMASEYEGFSMCALEASAMGLTVISTPVSGIVDYIVPGKNGYLFQHEDTDSLVEILDGISDGYLSFCDPKDCVESVQKYSVPNYFRTVQDILESL